MRAGLPAVAGFGVVSQVVLTVSGFWWPLLVAASVVAVVVAGAAVVVLARRVVGAAGRERLAWGLVAAGSVLWLVGTVLSLATAVRGEQSPPPQPEAIVGGLGAMLAMLCPILGPDAALPWRERLRMAADGAMAATAMFVPAWAYLLAPAYRDVGGLFTTIIAIAVCVQICTTAVSLVLLSRHRAGGTTAFTMLAAAFGVFGVTTVVYCSLVLRGVSEQMASVSALMTVGTCLLLRMGRYPMPTDVPPWGGAATGLRAGLPYLPVVCAFPVAVTCWFAGAFDGVLFAAMSVLFLLVLLRQFLALYGNSLLLAEVDRARADLQYQATHDHLTGLTNRKYLYERAAGWGRTGAPVALLLIDLDGFKQINDRFGHAVGDEVLVEVAGVLTTVVPPEHTASRLGGDEFAVVLEPAPSLAAATAAGERIVALVSAAGRVGASVGLAYEPAGRATLGSMLSDADAALYRAKATGKGRVVLNVP
ncbi:MAG TPA: GGDEF domain-containing protein [Actinoplanes sp.]|nr:GGDEF domain-containing protein [Actinoplanes sp.]